MKTLVKVVMVSFCYSVESLFISGNLRIGLDVDGLMKLNIHLILVYNRLYSSIDKSVLTFDNMAVTRHTPATNMLWMTGLGTRAPTWGSCGLW